MSSSSSASTPTSISLFLWGKKNHRATLCGIYHCACIWNYLTYWELSSCHVVLFANIGRALALHKGIQWLLHLLLSWWVHFVEFRPTFCTRAFDVQYADNWFSSVNGCYCWLALKNLVDWNLIQEQTQGCSG
jgi:hypothetical protein